MDLKERQNSHLKEALARLGDAQDTTPGGKWTDEIRSLTDKLAQAEHHLAMQHQHFVGLMEQYTDVSKDVDRAHRQQKQALAAEFKNQGANAQHLLDQQKTLFNQQLRQMNAIFDAKLRASEEALAKEKAKAAAKIAKANEYIERLLKENGELANS